MHLSQLASSIAESPTLKLTEEARLLREKGEAVIHLGAGEPKNKAPLSAIQSASAKLASGDIKYTPTDGIPSLKKAIISYTQRTYNKMVSPHNVIVSAGAKQAVFNLLYSILNPKEEVILLAPYWVSYPEMVRMCNGVPIVVMPEQGSFRIRMQDVAQKVSPSTRAIIVNSPNNPSGVMYSKEFIGEIIDFCEKKEIYCVMDDIYHQLVFDGDKSVSAYDYANKDVEKSKVVTVNGISKMYGMTGFRIGWTIAPKPLVEIMTNVQGQITTTTSVILQVAAEGALMGPQNTVEDLRITLENNRNVMLEELNTIKGLKTAKPAGAFYCFPDFRAFRKSSIELSTFLLQKALVVTVPGKEFGMEGYLRLSFCGSIEEIKQGVQRIKWALDPGSPSEITIGGRTCVRDWL